MQKLKTKKFNFRTDVPALFDVINMPNVRKNIIHKPPINTLPEFDEWIQYQLKGYFHDFLAITDINEFEFVGCIYSYDFSDTDLNCKIALNIADRFFKSEALHDIFVKFCNSLLAQYPLHKIFCVFPATHAEMVRLLEQGGFLKEGELKEAKYIDGKFIDMGVWALDRAGIIDQG